MVGAGLALLFCVAAVTADVPSRIVAPAFRRAERHGRAELSRSCLLRGGSTEADDEQHALSVFFLSVLGLLISMTSNVETLSNTT